MTGAGSMCPAPRDEADQPGTTRAGRRILVAGVGNVFLGDDGFGVEVAQRLQREAMPEGVDVEEFGIRGVHLAYALLDGYDELILLDAAPRGAEPGTVSVLEHDVGDLEPSAGLAGIVTAGDGPLVDAHGLSPDAVFALLGVLGGHLARARVVGCEPADLTERLGLSAPVAQAVDVAVDLVRRIVREAWAGPAQRGGDGSPEATAPGDEVRPAAVVAVPAGKEER